MKKNSKKTSREYTKGDKMKSLIDMLFKKKEGNNDVVYFCIDKGDVKAFINYMRGSDSVIDLKRDEDSVVSFRSLTEYITKKAEKGEGVICQIFLKKNKFSSFGSKMEWINKTTSIDDCRYEKWGRLKTKKYYNSTFKEDYLLVNDGK